MKHVIDESDAGAAIIRKHLPKERHLQLIEETHEMLEAGAVIEDILWIVTPRTAMADRRQEALAQAEEGGNPDLLDLLHSLPDRVDGRMFVLYIGPEGFICQRWESALTMSKAGLS